MISREPIVTERLRLEPAGIDHADVLWEASASSLEQLRPWLPWARTATAGTTRQFARRSESAWSAGTDFAFVVFDEDDLVGGMSVHTPRIERLGELGYWTRTDRAGRGYATEAGHAALAFGFDVLGLYRVELRAGVDNVASQRVAEKLGFTREGTLRRGCPSGDEGGYDCFLYGLLATDR